MNKPLTALFILLAASLFVPMVRAAQGAASASISDIEIGTEVGQSYPDFYLPNLDGGFGRLSDYRGKKVLLFHFASW